MTMAEKGAIKAIDKTSVHRITSGQVVIDLQTAVKELVENSLDARATNIEVRFKQHGLKSIEVIDNGFGIPEQYHDSVALKHYTSKLSTFSDLTTVRTFGFRGEALSSLCALSEAFVVNTTTEPPMGVCLEMDANGKVAKRSKIARQRGTTVSVTNLFKPLPVRRKEFERNVKREFGKALGLLNAYALIGSGVRFTVNNAADKGQKSVQLRTTGASSSRAVVTELWGPKALENIIDLDLTFEVGRDKISLKRTSGYDGDLDPITVSVKGLISKFTVGGGRTGTDRQFFYVNGRPCNMNKIQKAFNEVYRSFNANQAPFILADFIIPTDSCDINVSPDKRTVFLSSENNIISKLKTCLEETFASSRSTYDVGTPQSQRPMTQATLPVGRSTQKRMRSDQEEAAQDEEGPGPSKRRLAQRSSSPLTGGTSDKGRQKSMSPPPISPSPAKSNEHQPSSDGRSSAAKQPNTVSPPSAPQTTPSSAKSSSPRPSPVVVQAASLRQMTGDAEDDVNDGMDTDADLEPSSDAPGDTPIVLNTSAAIWNRPEPIIKPANDKDIPVRRGPGRLVSSLCGTRGSEGNEKKVTPVTTKDKVRQPRNDLRNRLSGFARTGSQIPVVRHEDEDDQDEAEREHVEVEAEERGETEEMEHVQDSKSDQQTGAEDQLEVSADLPPARSLSSPVLEPVLDIEVRQSMPRTIDLTASDDGFDDTHINSMVDESSSVLRHEEVVSRPEVLRTTNTDSRDITLRFDVAKISGSWRNLEGESTMSPEVDPAFLPHVPSAAGVLNTENDESAAKALARIIDKKDFAMMDIIGQFNLGFIVTRRRKAVSQDNKFVGTVMDDLFIVDQHAADEKYNFETLQQTTVINSQKLFKPQRMELTASDELVALENMDVLRRNGFEVEEVGEDDEVRQGARLRLIAQPVSKSTTFDMKDLEELIHLMRDRPTGQMVRCSKARAMFAMRACRKSVMVGMPLNKHQMSTVVNHMGTMDQPWNCPHGRPTMRHLLDLQNPVAAVSSHKLERQIDWSKFVS
ncbi:hypothetical protein H2248_003513 [Termitomyces sp. 'cryptogamus']|nr:hypothetical protein H2248_003513 [Termitomyces sp. 'cryptogamus']